MIKKDYYATNKQGNCVNYGFSCFSCSHWHGYFNNGSCDMFKTSFTTTNLDQCEMTDFTDFKILGKFKGDDIEFMKFDIELHSLLRKYNIIWKEINYVEEQFTEKELKK